MKDIIADRYLSNAVFMDTWTDVARNFLRKLVPDYLDAGISSKLYDALASDATQSPWSAVSNEEWQDCLEESKHKLFGYVIDSIVDKHKDEICESLVPKLMRRWKKRLKSMKEECIRNPDKFAEELVECLMRDKLFWSLTPFMLFIDKRRLAEAVEEVNELSNIEKIMEQ